MGEVQKRTAVAGPYDYGYKRKTPERSCEVPSVVNNVRASSECSLCDEALPNQCDVTT